MWSVREDWSQDRLLTKGLIHSLSGSLETWFYRDKSCQYMLSEKEEASGTTFGSLIIYHKSLPLGVTSNRPWFFSENLICPQESSTRRFRLLTIYHSCFSFFFYSVWLSDLNCWRVLRFVSFVLLFYFYFVLVCFI